jgi:hypothetical protein
VVSVKTKSTAQKKTGSGIVGELQNTMPLHSSSWFLRETPDTRSKLLEIKQAFHAGKLPGWGPTGLYAFVKENVGICASRSSFREWLGPRKDSHAKVDK